MNATKTKERPILMNNEMVRAILDGRKTKTRRIVRLHKGQSIYADGKVHPACPYHSNGAPSNTDKEGETCPICGEPRVRSLYGIREWICLNKDNHPTPKEGVVIHQRLAQLTEQITDLGLRASIMAAIQAYGLQQQAIGQKDGTRVANPTPKSSDSDAIRNLIYEANIDMNDDYELTEAEIDGVREMIATEIAKRPAIMDKIHIAIGGKRARR